MIVQAIRNYFGGISYYQWGSGTKYYYTPGNEMARKRAKTKAEQQRSAAYASGYDG